MRGVANDITFKLNTYGKSLFGSSAGSVYSAGIKEPLPSLVGKTPSLKIIGSKKTIIFDDVSKIIKIIDMSINKNLEPFSNGEDIIDFDKSELPLTSEIKSFLSYFDAPDHCITGYSHTRNVIKIFEEYYKNRKFIS